MKSRLRKIWNAIAFIRFAHEHRLEIDPKKRFIGILGILFAYFLFSCSTVLFPEVSHKIPIFQIFFINQLVACTIFGCFLLKKGKGFKAFRINEKALVLSRGAVGVGTYYAYFSSKITSSVIDNTLLFSTDPLIVPLALFLFFRTKITKWAWSGLFVGFVGVGLVYWYDAFSNTVSSGVIGILSGAGLAYVVVITSYIVKKDKPVLIAFYQTFIGAISSFIFMFFSNPVFVIPSLFDLFSMIAQGIFFAIALFLFLQAFYYTEAHIIGGLGYSLTLFVVLLETFVLKNPLSAPTLWGTVLISGGGIIIILDSYISDKKKEKHYSSD